MTKQFEVVATKGDMGGLEDREGVAKKLDVVANNEKKGGGFVAKGCGQKGELGGGGGGWKLEVDG